VKFLLISLLSSFLFSDNIFIQQEHEGNLSYYEWRDGGYGNVFAYYEPVEFNSELLKKVSARGNIIERINYYFGRVFGLRQAFDSLSPRLKQYYLELLAKKYQSDGKKVWEDRKSLVLIKKKEAPSYIDDNPSFERFGEDYGEFNFPEIITSKNGYSRNPDEALERAKRIVKDTSHAGIHFHVFIRIDEKKLREELSQLLNIIALENDKLFLESALLNFDNLSLPAIEPWHKGRSEIVRSLIEKNSDNISDWDENSTKRVFLAFRYWGRENGKVLISLEIRGLRPDFIIPNKAIRGLEDVEIPRRDYSKIESELKLVWVVANALSTGKLPEVDGIHRELDVDKVKNLIESRARERKIAANQVLNIKELSSILGHDSVPLGYLLPFGGSESSDFIDDFLQLGRYRKNPSILGRLFYDIYTKWARLELQRTIKLHNNFSKKIYGCKFVFGLLI